VRGATGQRPSPSWLPRGGSARLPAVLPPAAPPVLLAPRSRRGRRLLRLSAWCGHDDARAPVPLGRGFRHEKTKAKRSTYRGGLIDTTAVNSVKFEYDDE